jgi:sugar/nucleoside kinase (ribokinase family)
MGLLQVEAIVAGHLCLDIMPALSRGARFAPGRTVEAGPVTLATGGAVSNTGVALHRLGVAVRLVGKVGVDLYGRAVRDIIESYGAGLADGLVAAPGESSAYTIILSLPDADRMFIHHPGCNATFGADDVDPALLAQARLLHFGYPPIMARMRRNGGQELLTLLRRAKQAGITTSLDWTMIDPAGPAGRIDWQAMLAVALPYVDVFMPNIEELLLALDRPSFDRLTAEAGDGAFVDNVPPELLQLMGAEMLGLGAAMVGLKAGHRGLYLCTAGAGRFAAMGRAAPTDRHVWAGRELWAPCFAANLVGATGAGDATIAGFLMGLLRGFTPERALVAATAVGACSVEAADALGGVRGWAETEARLAAGWPRLPLEVESPGWEWDERQGVWVGPDDGLTS